MIRQLEDIKTTENKKVFFASDFHLGTHAEEPSLVREKKVVKWLRNIKSDAQHIFILGDIFDFWFEYKYTIPKGFTSYPNPGTILAYQDGAGFIDFDQKKAEKYFDTAVERVKSHLLDIFKRWDRL